MELGQNCFDQSLLLYRSTKEFVHNSCTIECSAVQVLFSHCGLFHSLWSLHWMVLNTLLCGRWL